MPQNIGNQTIFFEAGPTIAATAAVVGQKEGEGPLGEYFDKVESDEYFGQSTWEKAESAMLQNVTRLAMDKAAVSFTDIDFVLAGDLLNQCTSSNYAMRNTGAAFFGLFGACSTMAESLVLGATLVAGGSAQRVMCVTGSHFCSAERQFRQPLEYGGQRPPTAQWTVTGGGAAILEPNSRPPYITHATVGKIIDMGVTDTNNMGAAMAPAFVDTLICHFNATERAPDYYDLIVSGDLGSVGRAIAADLCKDAGFDIQNNYNDCGCMIFEPQKDNMVNAGGSGCGCGASVLCGHLIEQLSLGKLNKVLFVATGALMSPTTTFQGESIPSVAHAVAIEN